jgi:hypothetical protein
MSEVQPNPEVSEVEDVMPDKTLYVKGGDKALELITEAGTRVELTEENNRRVLRKIDLHLMPLMLLAYFLQQLDKSTLSYSSVFGIVQQANLKGTQYSWLGSVVYVAQLAFQPLIAYVLVLFPVGKFLSCNMFCWGVVLSFMALAHNFQGLMVTRFLLGMFEASIAPTFVAVSQLWYRRAEQTNRVAAWYAMNGVSLMIGSLLTYGLGHIKSSLHSYQIIFLFSGLVTVAVSILMFFYFPDSPLTAKFLTQEEKLIAVERLRHNRMGIQSETWKWNQVRETLCDPKSWFWGALLFCIAAPSGGVGTFGPLIIKSFGFNSFQTILLNVPWGFLQALVVVISSLVATKFRLKSPVLLFLCVPPLVGCVILYKLPHDVQNRGPLLAGYYLTGFLTGISPLLYAWSASNTAGDTKKKVTTGLLFMGQSAGNIVGPLLYNVDQAPLYRPGLESNMALFSVLAFLVVANVGVLIALNKYHAKKCISMGKEPPKDLSMATGRELGNSASLVDSDIILDNSLRDETDLKNEDFVYVL